jgi:iron complex transport system substrate-binding protein
MKALVIILALLTAFPAMARPERVVSLNLCTDQLALLLLGPDRLVSVSLNAADKGLSNMLEEAADYPLNNATTEAAVAFDPDLILVGMLRQAEQTRMLRGLGYNVLAVPDANSIEDSYEIIRMVAEALDAREKGEALIKDMKQALAVMEGEDLKPPVRALVLQPRGGTVGAGTLVNDILDQAGLVNIGEELGIRGSGTLGLEDILRTAPDLLIHDQDVQGGTSMAQALLDHPALADMRARTATIAIPTRMWWCPGPWLVEAVERLRAKADRLRR